jgi:hypothetical protein
MSLPKKEKCGAPRCGGRRKIELGYCRSFYTRLRRRRLIQANPNSAEPNNASDAGSGAGTTETLRLGGPSSGKYAEPPFGMPAAPNTTVPVLPLAKLMNELA